MKHLRVVLSLVIVLSIMATGSWGANVYIQGANGEKIPIVPNQVLVRYKNKISATTRLQSLTRLGAQTKRPIQKLNVDVVSIPAGQTVESFIETLKSDPDIAYAEPNAIAHIVYSPNDPFYTNSPYRQYHLKDGQAGGNGLINIQEAWDLTTGDAGVVVAVLDTGAAQTHPDLVGKLVDGVRMENDMDGDGVCTGLYDQCAGSNPEDDNYPDNTYHGTFVSGLIAANTDNGQYIAGVAPLCKIMPVKVMTWAGGGTHSAIAEGIIYAVDHGAKVINMSLGSVYDSSVLDDAVKYAVDNDVVVVAASGNCGCINCPPCPCGVMYPAAIDRVIAVGATDISDTIADFSCKGGNLDLVAPGVEMFSIISGPSTATGAGTSFAAPLVSGVAALIRSLDSSLSAFDVGRYLVFSADDLGSANFDSVYGFGRVNAGHALQAAQAKSPFISSTADPGETFPCPNPFQPTTGNTVRFSLPESLGSENIEIQIFNLLGHKVKTISGTNVWDGRNDDGNTIAAGFYFYYAKTSAGSKKGKLTVIK